jgi:hypothetical protein
MKVLKRNPFIRNDRTVTNRPNLGGDVGGLIIKNYRNHKVVVEIASKQQHTV